ncbi:phage tail protein [Trinickia dinghuensis]|uniref:Phage tail protein n=1 Tax=Trinickia dinghuensis TaxID=2291023 RepID=A0A3D8JPM8_9BURK|nr:tail fiber protein [Trinickia dinghuensis]RDU95059.1 phage tail protein [Trinickia dinghuensis]
MSDPYLGEIRMFGFNFAPYSWALCQGQTISIQQNTALFSLLGTFYGGDGVSNFQLPNLQSRSPVGMGQGLGLSNISIGEQGGIENVSLTIANMPSHTHVAAVTGGGAVTGQISIPATTSTASGTQTAAPGTTAVLGPVSVSDRQGQLYSTATDGATTLKPFNVTLQGTAPTITNSLVGNNIPIALRNPYIGINFCIALQGVFPSRG